MQQLILGIGNAILWVIEPYYLTVFSTYKDNIFLIINIISSGENISLCVQSKSFDVYGIMTAIGK